MKNSAADTSAHELQQYITDMLGTENTSFHFKTTAVLRKQDDFTFAEISLNKGVAYATVLPLEVRKDCTDIKSAFKEMARLCHGYQLCIDTVIVSVKGIDAERYLSDQDPLLHFATSAWAEVFGNEVRALEINAVCADALAKLQEELSGIGIFESTCWIKCAEVVADVELYASKENPYLRVYLRDYIGTSLGGIFRVGTLLQALATMVHCIGSSEMLIDTLIVKTNKLQKGHSANEIAQRNNSIYTIVRAVYGEIFSCINANDANNKASLSDPEAIRRRYHRRNMLEQLSGRSGVKLWNKRPLGEKQQVDFAGSDFEHVDFKGVDMSYLAVSQCNFSGSSLVRAKMSGANASGSSFVGADLSSGRWSSANVSEADFTDADLRKSQFDQANLANAVLTNANVAGVNFKYADLCGVDLTDFNAEEAASFQKARYDETTVLPDNFSHWSMLQWKGHSADPYKLRLKLASTQPLPLDFAGFLKQLSLHIDPARVAKALSMLKKERFELFSETLESDVTGIIRSQTNSELVYACYLNRDGAFACCTQNLNACGGLRGAVCKHILVLIIGLVKADAITPSIAAQSVLFSKTEQPMLNKDRMGDFFIKYQGAQAGDLDWRPTETMPEDYYSY